MSYQKPDLNAYNQLQRAIFQSKQFRNKSMEQKRSQVKIEWKKLKSSLSFSENENCFENNNNNNNNYI